MASDLLIVGGGTAGLQAARGAVALGLRPTLVTDGPIGGDCTFTGCIPSKTLLSESRKGSNFDTAMAAVHRTVEEIAATESADVLRGEGVEVIEGRAIFTGPTSVTVDGGSYTASKSLIATGAKVAVPPIPGLADIPYLTNETLFEITTQPQRLAIFGAGAIGCEMAMAFAGFGTTVSLFESAERVLPGEEPEASAQIEESLTAAGVHVHVGSPVDQVLAQQDNAAEIAAGAVRTIVDAVLVATGRRANVSGMGLDELGVELDSSGSIVVDAKLRTSVANMSAAGDVTGLLPFTHAADEQARMAVGHAFRKGSRWDYDASTTPWVIFTDPEVARVGLTEAQAATHGGRVAFLPLHNVDRALTDGRTDGFVKLIAGPKRITGHRWGGKIIGATIVAPRAGEMIHGPTLAARLGFVTGRLAQVTTPYPTWTTAIQQAAAMFFRPINGLEARDAKS